MKTYSKTQRARHICATDVRHPHDDDVTGDDFVTVDGNASMASTEPLIARQMSMTVVVNRICFTSLLAKLTHGVARMHVCHRSPRTDSPKFQHIFQNKF